MLSGQLKLELYGILNEDCVCRGLERLQPTKRRWRCANLCCVFCEGRQTVRSLMDRRWLSAPGDKRGEISSVTIWLVAFQLSICLRDSHSGGLVGGWGLGVGGQHTRTHTGYSDRHTHTDTQGEAGRRTGSVAGTGRLQRQ